LRRFPTQGSEPRKRRVGRLQLGRALRRKRVAVRDSASVQAVTRVNVEQASKRAMRKPTRLEYGEGCHGWGSERNVHPAIPPG
jgi:hypothetical protein